MENENRTENENKAAGENKGFISSLFSIIGKFFGMIGSMCLLIAICGIAYMKPGDLTDQLFNFFQKEDRHVVSVKHGTNPYYSDITYAEAFDKFFLLPAWKYIGANKHGVKIVEFTGRCSYHDVDVKANIRFSIDKDGRRFKAESLAFNDVPQDEIILAALIDKAFSEYRKAR